MSAWNGLPLADGGLGKHARVINAMATERMLIVWNQLRWPAKMPKRPFARTRRICPLSALCECATRAAKVSYCTFPSRGVRQLRGWLRAPDAADLATGSRHGQKSLAAAPQGNVEPAPDVRAPRRESERFNQFLGAGTPCPKHLTDCEYTVA